MSTEIQMPEIEKEYGCIFCVSGKEEKIAKRINETIPALHAMAVRQVKRQTAKGMTQLVTKVVFLGYVFFEGSPDNELATLSQIDGVIKLLRTADGEWRLRNSDAAFVRMILSYGGTIGMSTAYEQGDRIRIASGPLKDLEGYITRIDRRNKNGQVSISLNGREMKVWLGFEMVDRVE